MALLNYTTEISAQKTVSEITAILGKHGVRAVLTNYDADGQIEALSFQVLTVKGEIGIRLPVDPDAVLAVMAGQNVTPRYCNQAQATRVAWRIVKVWIQAQMAFIETGMVNLDQVFLPYWVMPSGETLYAHVIEAGFQLTEGG